MHDESIKSNQGQHLLPWRPRSSRRTRRSPQPPRGLSEQRAQACVLNPVLTSESSYLLPLQLWHLLALFSGLGESPAGYTTGNLPEFYIPIIGL